jgi:hypothetical protein
VVGLLGGWFVGVGLLDGWFVGLLGGWFVSWLISYLLR